jgi:hypothetical protein
MTSIADSSVKIQTTSESNLSTPCWFGEVVLLISSLQKHGVLTKISEGVRFARRRFGRYEVIDFLAVQIALRDQRRTDLRGVLRQTPALCRSLHGRGGSATSCPPVRPSPVL